MDDVAAKRYAMALWNLAVKAKAEDAVKEDLELIQGIYASSGFGKFLASPEYSLASKTKVIDEIGQKCASKYLALFLHLLLKKTRTELLPEIITVFRGLYKKSKGITSCEITLANSPTQSLIKNIEQRLKQIMGGTIEMTVHEKPSIIGGVEIRVGNRMIDASFRRNLSEIEKILLHTNVN